MIGYIRTYLRERRERRRLMDRISRDSPQIPCTYVTIPETTQEPLLTWEPLDHIAKELVERGGTLIDSDGEDFKNV